MWDYMDSVGLRVVYTVVWLREAIWCGYRLQYTALITGVLCFNSHGRTKVHPHTHYTPPHSHFAHLQQYLMHIHVHSQSLLHPLYVYKVHHSTTVQGMDEENSMNC